MKEIDSKTPYFKLFRKGIIYVCEASSCKDDDFCDHVEPHVFFEINAHEAVLDYCPPCPICSSKDKIFEHEIAELKTIKVLNEDEEESVHLNRTVFCIYGE
ncbi:hypothetical protein [Paenibacillus polymyxa]|uniref:hypothetical protein n=1 Tax=Paenibacillus polymyxa TaxID=1406 RepID=UPI000317090B|nr:hypothetical protein [Paenibacillus polymyxa]